MKRTCGILLLAAVCGGIAMSQNNKPATVVAPTRGVKVAEVLPRKSKDAELDTPVQAAVAEMSTRSDNAPQDGQSIDRDASEWFKEYRLSEKARSIERNLGFD